jgi:hypothetical protein
MQRRYAENRSIKLSRMKYQAQQALPQAAAIHQWRPWTRSTGPRSAVGRAVVASNSTVHAARSVEAVALQRAVVALLDQVQAATAELATTREADQ